MPAFLDTSVIVRYLTGEPLEMAERAAALIDTDTTLLLTETALAETGYVLQRVYGIERAAVVDLLIAFLQKENIAVHQHDTDLVIAALLLCRPSGRISFADALIWAAARSAATDVEPAIVYSFDQRFPATGIELRADF